MTYSLSIQIIYLLCLSLSAWIQIKFFQAFNITFVAIAAISGYTFIILSNKYNIAPVFSLAPALLLATAYGVAAEFISLPLSKTERFVSSIGTVIILTALIRMFGDLTGGGRGLVLHQVTDEWPVAIAGAGGLVLLTLALILLMNGTRRVYLQIMGDDYVGAAFLGIAPWRRSSSISVLASAFAALAGVTTAWHAGVMTPATFSLNVGFEFLALGALGAVLGVHWLIVAVCVSAILPISISYFVSIDVDVVSSRQLLEGIFFLAAIVVFARRRWGGARA